MRLALFGGTFDPIHSGHIEAALAAAEACDLDRILVVPSGIPPHKQEACRANYEHRFRMVELACSADSRLEASRLEEPRPDAEPHYSVDTIKAVRSGLEFDGPLHFVIGADAFSEVNLWKDFEQVAVWVEFIVVERVGFGPTASPESEIPPASLVHCSHPASSRILRHRSKIGGSLADLAPPAVCAYLWEHRLYRT